MADYDPGYAYIRYPRKRRDERDRRLALFGWGCCCLGLVVAVMLAVVIAVPIVVVNNAPERDFTTLIESTTTVPTTTASSTTSTEAPTTSTVTPSFSIQCPADYVGDLEDELTEDVLGAPNVSGTGCLNDAPIVSLNPNAPMLVSKALPKTSRSTPTMDISHMDNCGRMANGTGSAPAPPTYTALQVQQLTGAHMDAAQAKRGANFPQSSLLYDTAALFGSSVNDAAYGRTQQAWMFGTTFVGVSSATGGIGDGFLGAVSLASIFSGSPATECTSGTVSDVALRWDDDAERWVVATIAGSAGALCVAVSDTPSFLGAWSYVSFVGFFNTESATGLGTQLSLGVWNHVYMVCAVVDGALSPTTPWTYCMAINRYKLLTQTAGYGFDAMAIGTVGVPSATHTEYAQALDLGVCARGPLVLSNPGGVALGIFPSLGATGSYIGLFVTAIDFDLGTATLTTVAQPLTVGDFSVGSCAASDRCVPTPGVTVLDPLRGRASFAYCSSLKQGDAGGGVEDVLAWAVAVDTNGVQNAKIQWGIEPGFSMVMADTSGHTLVANASGDGTYGGDVHAWAPVVEIDPKGALYLGYNVASSTSLYPEGRFTYRLRTDPVGALRAPGASFFESLTPASPSTFVWNAPALALDPVDAREALLYIRVAATNPADFSYSIRNIRVANTTQNVVYTATDACDNTEQCGFQARLGCVHPTVRITCPAAYNGTTGDPITPIAIGFPTTSGGCTTPTLTYSDTPIDAQITLRTWKATDIFSTTVKCGTTNECEQIITLVPP